MKNKSSNNRILLLVGLTVFASILFVACNKNDDDTPQPASAGLMSFNISKDLPSVGFAISGNVLTNSPLGYNNYTGVYQRIFTGNRAVEAYIYGTQNIVTSSNANFEGDKYYSVFLVGTSNNYTNLITRDNFDSLESDNGKAYIRYINAIPDSAAMQVTFKEGANNILDAAAPFKSVSEFVAVNPGTVNISIAITGHDTDVTRDITVEAKKVYTVLLSEKPEYLDPLMPVEIKYIENGVLSN